MSSVGADVVEVDSDGLEVDSDGLEVDSDELANGVQLASNSEHVLQERAVHLTHSMVESTKNPAGQSHFFVVRFVT